MNANRNRISRLAGPSTLILLCIAIAAGCPPHVLADSPEQTGAKTFLHEGWALQSSCLVKATGEQISTTGFETAGWHAISVPSTVVAALVADKTYPDPYFGMNLRSIPGTTYPIGVNFAQQPMPKNSPFRCSWWYRTEFQIPRNSEGHHLWLHFSGINYRANIWLNGKLLAGTDEVAGMYRTYEFDVTSRAASNKRNVLAVETFAQTETDLGINWQDWNPAPPDRDMGLYSDVYLQTSGPVAIRHPQVVTHFPGGSLGQADLTVMAELKNATDKQVTGRLEGQIEDLKFQQNVELKPGESRTIRFTPENYAPLHVLNPKLWWPAPLGPQNLHKLSMRFAVGNEDSDAETIRFGIREVTSELNSKGFREYRVNGTKVLIRGGGWAEDMLLRRSHERLDAQFRYVRAMGLNTIRLEGQLESDEFYDLADQYGILVMPGWVCCTYWQEWEKWRLSDLEIAAESLRSQILRMRSHPSVFVWLNGSDVPPPPVVEKTYLDVLQETDWPNPTLSSAAAAASSVTGPSGVKMSGPYDYVPPAYWLTDPGKYGGAYSFNTETGPGPAIPTLGSLRKMLSAEHLWPIDKEWNFHAASESFSNLNRFNNAMNQMFGAPTGLDDYLLKAQAMTYDGERAMFEAYARNRFTSTGVIQWMLNNAWPSVFWHLYDYYLQPAGGYFGTKKACEPLHVQYSYDDRSIVVVNNLQGEFSGLRVTAAVYDFNMKKKFWQQTAVDIGAGGVERVLTIPEIPSEGAPQVYFVVLTLENSASERLSSNFYWLANRPAKIAWSKTLYFDDPPPPDPTESSSIYTPASPYDDLTMLNKLPRVRLRASASIGQGENGPRAVVKIQNPSGNLAFQVHLGIRKKGETAEIVPALWDDNYFELMPNESREIPAQFLSADALNGDPELEVTGWNIEPLQVPLVALRPSVPESGGEGN